MDQASALPRIMAYHLLEQMTNGFSEDRELGRGSYGKVYLGLHKDGEKIAVKMLRPMLGLDDEQFEKEYHNLERLQNENIVRLVGYCNETRREFVPFEGKRVLSEVTHRALCFEYMRNGSLDNCLSDEASGHDWYTRYAIIKGICNGLKYLHEELEPPIFHLDLKPANVLLDENMVAKIADFGLSRLMGQEGTRITTSAIGTIGYLPPEYINRHVISNKLDIFSLGVIIIKIMTGPMGYSRSAEMPSQKFIDLVNDNWRNRLQATASCAVESYSYCEQVKRCIEIALSCVEYDRHRRPTIGDIVHELNGTETVSTFPDVLRNVQGSSTEQESYQSQRRTTQVDQGKDAREEEPIEGENLFGKVVDNYMLDQMPRYVGKPKAQEDRAREALNLVDEDGKHVKASRYLSGLRSSRSIFLVPNTMCLVYNATGSTLYYIAQHDWNGRVCRPRYPTSIGNGQWAAFRHAPRYPAGSIGAVVYRGKNKDGINSQDYLLAWLTPVNTAFFRPSNKAYCEIGVVDCFQSSWHNIFEKMKNSGYSSVVHSDGCQIDSKIGEDPLTPWFTARIT